MTNKFFAFVFLFALVLGGAFMSTENASAQVATFPAGCTSALGYSITTGLPCNGTATATIGFLPGCTTALGFSTINGVPCSGGPVAIFFLAGCSSLYGYSTISGAPCNGTAFVTLDPNTIPPAPIPGLPTTGAGGNVLAQVFLLLASGITASFGLTRLTRNSDSV